MKGLIFTIRKKQQQKLTFNLIKNIISPKLSFIFALLTARTCVQWGSPFLRYAREIPADETASHSRKKNYLTLDIVKRKNQPEGSNKRIYEDVSLFIAKQ
jgi:hypothetical protein